MNRRAPELALLAGLLLAATFGGFGLWATGALAPSLVVAAALCYPFAAYAVVHDDDPTTVLPPRILGATGVFAAVPVAFDAVATASAPVPPASFLRGLFLGSLVALPPAAYAVGYGDLGSALPPRPAFAATVAVGVLLSVAGVLAGTAFGAAAGGLLALVGGLFARERGYRPGHDAWVAGLAGGPFVGAGLIVLALTRDVAVLPAVLSAVVVVLASGVYFALVTESAAFE